MRPMCGRFSQLYTWRDLHALYSITQDGARSNLEPRYNIAPTTMIDIILPSDDGHTLASARWGLVPMWWKKDLKELPSTFNARAETVPQKPMFRSAFKSRRCVIPASGFYEWSAPKGARQPHYITRTDGLPMSFAGLWEEWRHPETGEKALSATIIVCAANSWMESIHNRMPVILEQKDVDPWLREGGEDRLAPSPADVLQRWEVTPRMNSMRYKEADAVEPVATSA